MTGVLGATVAGLAGGKAKPEDFAPFYRDPDPGPKAPRRDSGPGSIAAAFAFLKANAKRAKPGVQKPQ